MMTLAMRITGTTILAGALLAQPGPMVAAQDDGRINIYRFVLGVDVPQPPAFVAMGVAPAQVLLGSAPKPVAGSVLVAFGPSGETAPGVAVDVAPYYLLGGGVRDLERYRSGSIAGRLMRVLTKTVLSIGAVRQPEDPASPHVAIGVRSTFHDPHDPILNSRLPENVAAALAKSDMLPAEPADETVTERGVDLSPIYADARHRMRGRAGDAQISGGWGVTALARGGVLDGDSLGQARHAFWLAAQYTAGVRYDLLATLQLRNAFRNDDRFWLGAALRRKSDGADVQVGLYYDTASKELHPGLAVDTRVSAHLGIVASIATQPDPPALTGPRRIRFGVLARWFTASDRPWP